MKRRLAGALIAMVLGVTLVAAPAGAVPAGTEVVFEGGGWGHGIGMPQWGAQGMAESGHPYDKILAYWYKDTGLRQASQITSFASGAAPRSVPETIRVGIHYVDMGGGVRQSRPFQWLDFVPENGTVNVCLGDEPLGACSWLANPGETWQYRWWDADGGFCEIRRGGQQVYSSPSACTVRLRWSDQPNTRVRFPGGDVGRTFARGHIAFLGPVTVNAQTGFHLNVVLGLDEYVYGIAEVPPSWHMEALKAQAVAARTYGAWKAAGGLKGNCSCHVVWDTSDQAYRGWHPNAEGSQQFGQRWRDAVDATAGQVVVYPAGSNAIAETYYSSSTGGATENVAEVWNSNQAQYPYLVSKPDPWSAKYAGAPTETSTIRWRHSRTAGQVVAALASTSQTCPTAPFPGLTELLSMEIVAHNASGSPKTIRVTGVANGQLASRDYHARPSHPCQDRIGTWRTRLGIRGHYIGSITVGGVASFSGSNLATSVGYHDRSSGIFSLLVPGSAARTFYFGNPADVPFAGDWTCNGVTTPGLYRVSTGFLFLRNTNTQGNADTQIYFGNPGDVPVAGDWNGDGCETVGIYRPSQATFYLRNSNTQGVADITVPFGNRGDVPLVGDWNGNGVTTVGVYRPSTRMVFLSNSTSGATVDIVYHYAGAQAGDVVITGDWNGSGTTSVGVYRPATGTFLLRNGFGPGGAEQIFTFGPPNRTPVTGRWG